MRNVDEIDLLAAWEKGRPERAMRVVRSRYWARPIRVNPRHTVQPLRLVESVDYQHRKVTLKDKGTSAVGSKPDRHPILIRWDHKQGDPRNGGLELRDGGAVIREGEGANAWLKFETGIQIQFESSVPAQQHPAGDSWLIPARTATGKVDWLQQSGEPALLTTRHPTPLRAACRCVLRRKQPYLIQELPAQFIIPSGCQGAESMRIQEGGVWVIPA